MTMKMASRLIDLISKKTNCTCSTLFLLIYILAKSKFAHSMLFAFPLPLFSQLQHCFVRLKQDVKHPSYTLFLWSFAITNQVPALLQQHTPWMQAAVMLGQSLYFSLPLSHHQYKPWQHPQYSFYIWWPLPTCTGKHSIPTILRKNGGRWTVYLELKEVDWWATKH